MARKKETPKPLLEIKHEFYASLDELLNKALMMVQAAEFIERFGPQPETLAELKKATAAFRAALVMDHDESRESP